ncbi:efflux RND transporter periplasmic adaptor subunit [Niveispirillum sp.]|uniref:efflux RND transporter periplasmic adaptor subunit n=1 Tax=Niveispirillum sp. TaxID=1917217 RepID=UPI001B6F1EFE|nr:efflux RND transporter periplasmic adaptor subunit [Niveispirillum sp.]MBP7338896.1 efflux RND transporter periplasmic adaptor subunit [Niveispirillum sp.]
MAMDRRIEKSGFQKHKKMIAGAAVALLVGAGGLYMALGGTGGQTVRVAEDRLIVSSVSQGQFEDFIPVRGSVEPLTSIFLDSVEGGRVERRFAEAGQFVKAGQPLLELTNTDLQLEVISREAQVIEQLNQLRTVELNLEISRLSNRQSLVEVEYKLVQLKRTLDRRAELIKTKAISQAQYDEAQDEYTYLQRRRDVLKETQTVTDRLRDEQFGKLKESTGKLQENLEFARRNLDNLIVKAPVDGQLTSLEAEVGQNKTRGERLGRIDRMDGFKVVAQVDEFYLPRLVTGQTAEAAIGSGNYVLRVAKIFPQVRDGQFRVELEFANDTPKDIRPGQSLQLRLKLGDTTTALLIPNGAFYQDTGGAWLFVVGSDGKYATKRNVQLGRRNAQVIEVKSGLDKGERVVTSAYGDMIRMDRIQLN